MSIDRRRGMLFLLLAALFWSMSGVLIKSVDVDGLPLGSMRSGLALIPIGLFILFDARRRNESAGRTLLPTLPVALGAFAYAGTVVLFVMATRSTTAANAILLQYTAPLWVALLSPLMLREPTDRRAWISVILAIGGVLLFFVDDVSATARIGDLYGLAAGLFFGFCIIALRHGRDGASLRMVFWGNVLALLIGLPFWIDAMPSASDIPAIVALGFGQLGAGYIFFALGIRHVGALAATLVVLLEPILNPIWVAWALGEIPSVYSLGGGAIVLAALTLNSLRRRVPPAGPRLRSGKRYADETDNRTDRQERPGPPPASSDH